MPLEKVTPKSCIHQPLSESQKRANGALGMLRVTFSDAPPEVAPAAEWDRQANKWHHAEIQAGISEDRCAYEDEMRECRQSRLAARIRQNEETWIDNFDIREELGSYLTEPDPFEITEVEASEPSLADYNPFDIQEVDISQPSETER